MNENEKVFTEANAITFALIAKHLLPKQDVETLSSVFYQLLKGDIGPQEMLLRVSKVIDNNQDVNMVWNTLIDRKGIHTSPLYNEISQIVQKFIDSDVPRCHIVSFIQTIITSTKKGFHNVDLISTVLGFQNMTQYKGITIPYLLVLALRIAARVPPDPKVTKDENDKIFNIRDLIAPEPEILTPKLPSIRIKKEEESAADENPEEEEKIISLGFSYQKEDFYITKNPVTLILNTYAKSAMNGSEGALDEHVSDFERFLSYIRFYALSSFEKFVVADISYYAISNFGGESRSILANDAIHDLYGNDALSVMKYVEETGDMSIVRKRCKKMLYDYASYRYNVSESTAFFSEVLPVFDAVTSIKFSEENEKTVFDFNPNAPAASFMLSEIARSNIPRLNKFMKEVVTLFTCDSDECAISLCNDAFASALYFFSKTCIDFEEILKPSCVGETSIDAILESAVCEVETKYDCVTRSELGSWIIHFIIKYLKDDELFKDFDLMIKKLGRKATMFFKLIANFVKLVTLVERVLVDRNYDKFMEAVKFYGHANGPKAEQRLRARIPFMEAKITPTFLGKLILVEMNGETKKMTISPTL